jgi:hypothetical protein
MLDACTLLAFTHVLDLLHRSAVAHQPLCHACTSADELPFFSSRLHLCQAAAAAGKHGPFALDGATGESAAGASPPPHSIVSALMHAPVRTWPPYARVHHTTLHTQKMREKQPAGQCRLGLLLLAYHVGPLLLELCILLPRRCHRWKPRRSPAGRSIQSNYYSPAGRPAGAASFSSTRAVHRVHYYCLRVEGISKGVPCTSSC